MEQMCEIIAASPMKIEVKALRTFCLKCNHFEIRSYETRYFEGASPRAASRLSCEVCGKGEVIVAPRRVS